MDDLPPLDPTLDLPNGVDREAMQDALLEGAPLPQRALVVEPEKVLAARQAWVTHGGNVAAVVRDTGLSANVVARLAGEHDWPLYGDGDSKSEKGQRTRLRRLHADLEQQMVELLGSLGVESKQVDDVIDKGLGSEYVAPLSQRSSAFKTVFDAYCKVGTMIAPEVFDVGALDGSGIRQRHGGVAGADRDLADFMANFTVQVADRISQLDRGEQAVIDVRDKQ